MCSALVSEKAFAAIRDCRTAALGGHVEYVEQCDTCGHRVISYNSCRDRHCPKCQAMARAELLAARQGELLPVPYFHVVFTLPQQIGGLALQNAREIYSILFRALRKRYSRSQPIPNVWALRSGSSPFCTPGGRTPDPASAIGTLFLIYLRKAFRAGKLKFRGAGCGAGNAG